MTTQEELVDPEMEVVKPKTEQELDEDAYNGFWQRQAKRIARIPRIFLGTAMSISIILSVIAFTVGGFDASVDNAGWQSRGTLIANRQTQLMLTERRQNYLFNGGDEAWDDLMTNVQKGWQQNSLGGDEAVVRRLNAVADGFQSPEDAGNRMKLKMPDHFRERLLQEDLFANCTTDLYFDTDSLENEEHLWPIWKAQSPSSTILSPELMHDVCVAELNTLKILEDKGLCFGCDNGCLPPYSPILYARLLVPNGFTMECKELSEAWGDYQASTETGWAQCVADLKLAYDPLNDFDMPASCPIGFSAALIEGNFDETKWMTYTSSIYPTLGNAVDAMYEIADEFDQGSTLVKGAYDTQYEGFNTIFTDSVVTRDMALACGSAFITALAILVHTRSPFITGIGLLQIILSFPLSFFVYTFIGGLDFFPFLNFIGVFVVFALGADDIFVSVDKWKNARIEHPTASTAVVAAIALPDAAGAMFLTTITTAIAFFGTAICPVAPIKMFAIFCGLLIMFDYLMCCLLVFPALCIYDIKLMANTSGCCNSCNCFRKKTEEVDESEEKVSLIHRILHKFYLVLHKLRWIILVLSLVGFGLAAWGATTLELPTSSQVRLVGEDAIQYEENFIWRKELLISSLEKSRGSDVTLGFGLNPADTGDRNNPKSWSQLVLDSTFDAAPEANQKFLAGFCPDLYSQDFAKLPFDNYTCSFNRFASWLEDQAASESPDSVYVENCANATGIPVPEANFDACIIGWTKLDASDPNTESETNILSYQGKVRIIFLSFFSRVRFDSPFDDLENEWNIIENWIKDRSAVAPIGVSQFFFSSQDFWWFDTNQQMLTTAYGGASIALSAAAIVIFISSRSVILTIFATFTIGYVLTSVTSTLVAIGWTLGFLESICFAILIGVSVDFVIHFCHAYSHASGDVDRHTRTEDALIRMGPSILAAGVTTIAAAIIMLFTIINFFQKFALILFMTIIQATIGSFVIFLALTDCIGPSNPTYMFDKVASWTKGGKKETNEGVEEPDGTMMKGLDSMNDSTA